MVDTDVKCMKMQLTEERRRKKRSQMEGNAPLGKFIEKRQKKKGIICQLRGRKCQPANSNKLQGMQN